MVGNGGRKFRFDVDFEGVRSNMIYKYKVIVYNNVLIWEDGVILKICMFFRKMYLFER